MYISVYYIVEIETSVSKAVTENFLEITEADIHDAHNQQIIPISSIPEWHHHIPQLPRYHEGIQRMKGDHGVCEGSIEDLSDSYRSSWWLA